MLLKKWVTEIWGQVLENLSTIVTMTRGWFALRFNRPKHASWILTKYWHIEMVPFMLKIWSPLFDPEREQLGVRPIWVRIPRLPLQFWTEDVLKCIGNYLGVILAYDKSFFESGKMDFAHILVHIDTKEGLVEILKLQWRGINRLQKLEYKGVPFRCRRCHEVGILYKECPLLAKDKFVEESMDGK